ncbi:uncharacterized protein LOC107460959 [Arachis duranensis]|uniref:Uncharacterized protein LOC107460959 n=1 Tax=Arachis duranensis TaxID=130453 RepID=A0A6P5MKG6_ARADU|nr:uncharacterized protein LOC107460959 [Arachis duranensis]
MARNFNDMFNKALYDKRRRQDNTFIDNWIDECLFNESREENIERSSFPTPNRWINRDRKAGYDRLFKDYFADKPVYNANIFRQKFRMRIHVFLRIVDTLSNVYAYFQHRVDAIGRRGLSPMQKCTAAMWMLAYGIAADVVDDYVCISGNTTIKCLKKIVEGVISVFDENTCENQIQMMYDAYYKWWRLVAFLALFDDILNDRVSEVNYTINGNNYTMIYTI